MATPDDAPPGYDDYELVQDDAAPPGYENFELVNQEAPDAGVGGTATLFQRDAPVAKPTAAQIRGRNDAIPENSAAGRVLSAFGQGFSDGWGAENFGIDRPELREWLEKTGMIGTPGGDKGVLGPITAGIQAFNEVMLRPAATALDLATRVPTAALFSLGRGIGRVGDEVGLKTPMNFIGENLMGQKLTHSVEQDFLGFLTDPQIQMWVGGRPGRFGMRSQVVGVTPDARIGTRPTLAEGRAQRATERATADDLDPGQPFDRPAEPTIDQPPAATSRFTPEQLARGETTPALRSATPEGIAEAQREAGLVPEAETPAIQQRQPGEFTAEELERKRSTPTFKSQLEGEQPTITPSVKEPAVAPVQEALTVDIDGAPVTFPDEMHRLLYEHADAVRSGRATAAERKALWDHFKGYVDDAADAGFPFGKVDDVDQLARDYADGILEGRRPGEATDAGRVVSPDEQPAYMERDIRRLRGQPAQEARTVPGAARGAAIPTRAAPAVEPGAMPRLPAIKTTPIKNADDVAVTPAGREVPVEYVVVDADSLVTSNLSDGTPNPAYPQELQPRDRTRAVSKAQVADIAQNLNPRLLDRGPQAADGAPIVSPDGIVESGNARSVAIQRAYDMDMPSAARYRDYLAAQGYPVEGIDRPVLVRVRRGELSPEDRLAFTREANERGQLGMSVTETAMADAAALRPEIMDLYRGGEVEAAANRDFVRAFISDVVGKNEQAGMITAEGGLTQEAGRRIRGAMLARAYGDASLIETLLESPDTNIKAIGGAITDVAGGWARMKIEARNGSIAATMDQTPALLAAVRLVERARREGQKVADYIRQDDIFGGAPLDPMGEAFLGLMFRDDVDWTGAVGRDKLAQALQFYVDEARKSTPGVDMFGAAAPEPGAIARLAREKQHGPAADTEKGLFQESIGGDGEGLRPSGRPGAGPKAARAEALPGRRAARAVDEREAARAADRVEADTSLKGVGTEELSADLRSFVREGATADTPAALNTALADWTIARGIATNTESAAVYDAATGKIISAVTANQENFVRFTVRTMDAMRDPNARVVVHHNHPSGASLSRPDIRALGQPGLRWIVAHTHDGAMYGAKLADDVRAHFGPDAKGTESLLDWGYQYVRKFMLEAGATALNNAGLADAMTSDLGNHYVNSTLHKAGLIDYIHTLEAPPAIEAVMTPLVDQLAKLAGRRLRQYGVKDVSDRRTGPLQHGEAIGGILGEPGITAGRPGGGGGPRPSARAAQAAPATRWSEQLKLLDEPGGPAGLADEPAPVFYSQLVRTVEGLKQTKAPAAQWRAQIKNAQGIKKEELDWLGVDDWLASKGTATVTKDELAQFVRENQVQVTETTFGERARALAWDELGPNSWRATEGGITYTVEADATKPGMWRVRDSTGLNTLTRTFGTANDIIDDVRAERGGGEAVDRPRYPEQTLGGGENYRELLLQLPEAERPEIAKLRNELEEISALPSTATEYRGEERFAAWDRRIAHFQQLDAERTRPKFRAPHFQSQENVLAHVRFNDRVDANGRRTLFIEEVQSDWHQQGRRQGYKGQELKPETQALVDEVMALERVRGLDPSAVSVAHIRSAGGSPELQERWAAALDAGELLPLTTNVPEAPFKTSWHELAMKRMLRWAAENGYEQLAWTTGEQQAARYDLSKKISKLRLVGSPGSGMAYLTAFDKSGREVLVRDVSNPARDLPELVGKEAADKLLKAEFTQPKLLPMVKADDLTVVQDEQSWFVRAPDGRNVGVGKGVVSGAAGAREYGERYFNDNARRINTTRQYEHRPARELEGMELEVGGQGMKGFYDKILPDFLNKYAKKWGAKVGETKVDTGTEAPPSWTEAQTGTRQMPGEISVHALEITDEMRQSVVGEGQALFDEPAKFEGAGGGGKPPEQPPEGGGAEPPKPEKPQKAGNINLDRINSPEDIKTVIRDMAIERDEFMGARRGRMTFEDIKRLADASGFDPVELVRRGVPKALTAEQALKSRNLLVQSATTVRDLAKQAAGGSDQARVLFEQALTRHAAIQEYVAGITAEAGRALSSFRIMAEATKRAERLMEIIDRAGGRDNIDASARAVLTHDTPGGVSRQIRELRQPTTFDAIMEGWLSSIFSGPQTHAANMLSNTLTLVDSIVERGVAAGIGRVRTGLGVGAPDRVFLGEVAAKTFGTIKASKEAVVAAHKAFTEELVPDPLTGKIDVQRPRAIPSVTLRKGAQKATVGGVPIPLTGEVTLGGRQARIPLRALSAEDTFFQTLNARGEAAAQAYARAAQEGLTGRARADRIAELTARSTPEEIMAAMQEIEAGGDLSDATKLVIARDEINQAAQVESRYRTFNTPLGKYGRMLSTLLSDKPVLRFIVPVLRTAGNLIKYAGERNPLLFAVSKEVRDNLLGRNGGRAQDTQIARLGLGTAIVVTTFAYAAQGKITGGGPSDPRQRALLMMLGWQPYSVLIGDTYYFYNRLDPYAQIMGAAADAYEISRAWRAGDVDAAQIGMMLLASVTQNLTSKTWLSGPSNTILAIEDPQRYGGQWIERFAGSWVPNILAQYNRAEVDPIMREVRGALDAAKARTPGQSSELPAKIDLFGNEIRYEGGLGPDFVSPIYMRQLEADPVVREMLALGVWKSHPERRIGGAELTAQEYHDYQVMAGRASRFLLDLAVNAPNWSSAPPQIRAETLNRLFDKGRELARTYMLVRDDDLFSRGIDAEVQSLTGLSPQQLERRSLIPPLPAPSPAP